MRITKEIAENAAKTLLKEKQTEINQLKVKRAELATRLYLSTLSKGVLDAFKKYPDYFNTRQSCRFNGPGLSYEYYNFTDPLPDARISRTWSVSTEEANELVSFNNKIDGLEAVHGKLKREIENALFSLRTYNKVKEEFPEAYTILPPLAVNTALMIDIKKIRCSLDSTNC